MLHRLLFDTTSALTIADSANVGAYLRASDGTLLTHTDVGGKKALDVRVAEGINVEVDLSHVDDSVKIGDGTDFMLVNADGSINAVVTATNLDIRDLVFATDKVDVTGSAVSITGTVAVTQSTSPWVVSDAALANTDMVAGAASLTLLDVEQNLITTPLTNRKYLWVYNNDNRIMYIGKSGAGIDATTGFPLPPGAMLPMRAGAAISIEWVSNKTAHDARYLELS